MVRRTTRSGIIASSIGSLLLLGTDASAQGLDRSVCVAAAERGQELRDAKKLRDARGQFALCAREECPAAVNVECKRWRAEAEAALGSIVLDVVDERGAAITRARVMIDGVLWTDEITREPIFVDPGSHEIEIERPGSERFVRNVTLAMGERDRVVAARLLDKRGGGDAGPRAETEASARAPASSTPVLPIVLGVAGAAAAGTAVTFWLLGNAELDDVRDRCRSGCLDAEIDGARTKHIVGDVALGVALVSVGAAIVLWLTRDTGSAKTAPKAASSGALHGRPKPAF